MRACFEQGWALVDEAGRTAKIERNPRERSCIRRLKSYLCRFSFRSQVALALTLQHATRPHLVSNLVVLRIVSALKCISCERGILGSLIGEMYLEGMLISLLKYDD